MSSGKKWKQLKTIFTPHGDSCGCGPNATDIIEPKPKSKSSSSDQKPSRCPSSSNSSWEIQGGRQSITDGDEEYTSSTISLNIDNYSPPLYFPETDKNHPKVSKTVSSCPKIHDCFAVVKESDDPYQDFYQSMLQMIFQNEIYSRRDLQRLLDCFLRLNSPQQHETILRAFMEICNGDGGDGGDMEIDR